jgi:hypothetical protein
MSVKAFTQHHTCHTLPTHDSSLLPAASTTPQSEEARHCPKHYLGTSGKTPPAPRPTTKVTPDQTRRRGRKGAAATSPSHHPSIEDLWPHQLQAKARNRQNRRQPPPSSRTGRSHLPAPSTLFDATAADSPVAAASTARGACETVATVAATPPTPARHTTHGHQIRLGRRRIWGAQPPPSRERPTSTSCALGSRTAAPAKKMLERSGDALPPPSPRAARAYGSSLRQQRSGRCPKEGRRRLGLGRSGRPAQEATASARIVHVVRDNRCEMFCLVWIVGKYMCMCQE